MEDEQGKIQTTQINLIPFLMFLTAFSKSLCSRLARQSKEVELICNK